MRARKNGEFLNVKIEQAIADELNKYAAETGFSKTAVVENALKRYFVEIYHNDRSVRHEKD